MKRSSFTPALVTSLLILAIFVSSCGSGGAHPTSSPPVISVTELITKVKQAAAGVKTYRVETIGSSVDEHNPNITSLSTKTELVDLEQQRFYLETYLLQKGANEVEQRRESYWIDGWVYQVNRPVTIPNGISTSWLKYVWLDAKSSPASVSSLQTFLSMLELSTVIIQGNERVNGIECYKLGVTAPDTTLPPGYPVVLSDMKIVVWVAQDDFRPIMQLMTYRYDYAGMVSDASYKVTFSQYGQVTISLPAEALGAQEVQAPSLPPTQ